jgi:hypothetical protein
MELILISAGRPPRGGIYLNGTANVSIGSLNGIEGCVTSQPCTNYTCAAGKGSKCYSNKNSYCLETVM